MLRKLLLGLVLLAVVCGAGVYLFARSVLSPESVRATLEQQLAARLGRPVTIGAASLDIFPRIALGLEQITVGREPVLSATELSVAVGWRGLLDRRVEEAELLLDGGRIRLPDAFALLAAASSAPADAPADGAFTIASVRVISLRNVEVVAGDTSMTVDLESALTGDRLDVSRLVAQAESTRLEAGGALSSVAALQGAFTVSANPLDVDRLLAFGSALTGKAGSTASSGAAATQSMRLTLDITAPAGRFAGYDFANLASKLEATTGRVAMPSLALEMFGGRFSGGLHLDSSGAAPRIQLKGQVSGIDVARLASEAGAAGSITGQLSGTLNLTASGTDAETMLRTARGTSSASIANGVIPGLDMVRAIVLAFGKPSGAPPPGSGSAFSRLGGDFALSERVIRTENLALDSRDFDLVGRATLSVPGGALDAAANVILSEELTAQAGTDLRRYAQEDGRVVVPARVGGTLGDPTPTIDVSAAARRALENELKRKAKGFLEGLFRKKK